MDRQVTWQVFLDAESKGKAERLLGRFAHDLGQEIVVVECVHYWKDPRQFRALFTSCLQTNDLASTVLALLQLGSSVAGTWLVGAPQVFDGDLWEFSGSAVGSSIRIPGVTYIDCQVSNIPAQTTELATQQEEVAQP